MTQARTAIEIQVGTVGQVLNSTRPGHKIRVVDDAECTGGFLIHEWWEGSDGPNALAVFDSWVKDGDALRQFFAEAGWSVDWST